MPNWCLNKLRVSGSEEAVDVVKSLILNKKGHVDFTVLQPIPAALEGATNALALTYDTNNLQDFAFCISNPDRVSLSTPEHFLSNVAKFCEENDTQEVLADLVSEGFSELLAKSDIIKPDVAIENSISDAVNEWRNLPDTVRATKDSPLEDDLVHIIMNAVTVDHDFFCDRVYICDNAYGWSVSKWGVKENVSESYPLKNPGDEDFGCEFGTAWTCPEEWFYTLMKKMSDSNVCVTSITLEFAEGNMRFGGRLGIDKNGAGICETYSDEEITAFLAENEEDEDDEGC